MGLQNEDNILMYEIIIALRGLCIVWIGLNYLR